MTDIATITAAVTPEDLFGDLTGLSVDEAIERIKGIYRPLAQDIHPDHSSEAGAGAAFAKLSRLYNDARRAIRAGEYGTIRTTPTSSEMSVQTRLRRYVVMNSAPGLWDTTAHYTVGFEDDDEAGVREGIMKVAASDLITHEAEVLQDIFDSTPEEFQMYIPNLVEKFEWREPGRPVRNALVVPKLDGWYNLVQVQARYPDGLHPKDAAWMIRRLFVNLGLIHDAGYVHGAVMPEHIMIHPTMHGMNMIDFKHSVPIGTPLTSVPPNRRHRYLNDAIDKQPTLPGLDFAMAADVFMWLTGKDFLRDRVKPLYSFLNGCNMDTMARSPQSGQELLEEFTDLIEKMWGPREYRPLAI